MKRFFLLLLFLAGCGRGCSIGEEVTVLFRVPASFDLQAPVVTGEGVSIGYIRQVTAGKEPTHVLIAVQKASLIQSGARFVAAEIEGKRGIRILAGKGDPLSNGAVVEADPTYSARAYYAELGKGMPGGITLPSGAHIPFPEALTHPVKDRELRRRAKLKNNISRSLRYDPKRFGRLDGGALAVYDSLESKIRAAEPEAALLILQNEGGEVRKRLEDLEQNYLRERNQEMAVTTRALREKIEKLERRLTRQIDREKRRAEKPRRERRVPPEFQ